MNNTVINKYIAVVNGKQTGLAGCQNKVCDMVCIRRHPTLEKSCDFNRHGLELCNRFIPVESAI